MSKDVRGKHKAEKRNSLSRMVGISLAGVSVATVAVAFGAMGTALAADISDTEQPIQPVTENPVQPETKSTVEENLTEDEKDEIAAAKADKAAENVEKNAAELKTTEVDPAKKVLDEAKRKAEDADAAVKDADAKVSDATNSEAIIAEETAKITKAQEDSVRAQTDKTRADDAVMKATEELTAAEKEAGAKKADVDAEVAKAQAAVDTAKKIVDNASSYDPHKVNSGVIGFLEWLRDSKKIDEATANTLIERVHRNIADSKAKNVNLNFADSQDPGSLEMLKKSLPLYPYVNQLRKSEGQSELKVDLAVLVDEIYNLKAGSHEGNHTILSGDSQPMENIAWQARWDTDGKWVAKSAFEQWYHSEKAKFDKFAQENPVYDTFRYTPFPVSSFDPHYGLFSFLCV